MTNTIFQPTDTSLSELSNFTLLQRAEHFGKQARLWRQKFLGLLPEINKRRLYLQKGFDSIFVFASMLGGVSKYQVEEILGLENHYQDTPLLHNLLVNGEVSHHKLARIASVANTENEEFLASQVQLLSRRSIDTLVKDIKLEKIQLLAGQKNEIEKDVPTITNINDLLNLELNNNSITKLKLLKEKGFDLNTLLDELIKKRDEEIQKEKEQMANKSEKEEKLHSPYIPTRIKNILKKEYGTKCAKEGCNKPSVNIHHTARQALTQSHNLLYLAPLCRQHHEIAHAIDIKVQKKKWRKL